jgi:hypothetical protein
MSTLYFFRSKFHARSGESVFRHPRFGSNPRGWRKRLAH